MIPRRGLRGARQLLEGFLPQWLQGAPTQVRTPLGAHELDCAIRLAEDNGIAERTLRSRQRLGARLYSEAPLQPFTPTDLKLAAVVYNLLALGHPGLGRTDARPRGEEASAIFTASILEELPRPRDLLAAVHAHTLVGRLFEAERNDAEVTTWLTTYRFQGRPVPPNITRFRRLRRVRVHGRRVEGVGLIESEDQFILLDRLLLRSPLTDLLHPDRPTPVFHLAGLTRWLGDAELCRSVIYQWASRAQPARVGEAVAQALHVRARGLAAPEEITLGAHALYHLHLLLLLEGTHRHEPPVSSGDLIGRWRAQRSAVFLALVLALREAGPEAGLPADALLGPELAERLAAFDPVARAAVDAQARERAEVILAAMFDRPVLTPFRLLATPSAPEAPTAAGSGVE